MPAGYSNVMPMHWWLPRTCFSRRRGRFCTPRPPRTPALNSRAPITLTRRSVSSMPHSTPTWSHEALADARRVGRELRRVRRATSHCQPPRVKTGWDSLTDAELKVVNLIAQGATNRSVAEQLHLSLHTVKTHVHNAFAKLDINSRAQLPQLMHGSD